MSKLNVTSVASLVKGKAHPDLKKRLRYAYVYGTLRNRGYKNKKWKIRTKVLRLN